MHIRLAPAALAIAAITTLTACGSSGGGDNNNGNTKSAAPTGTINKNNFNDYVDVALSTYPVTSIEGMPVGNYELNAQASSNAAIIDGTTFLEQLCEDGIGKVGIMLFHQGDSLNVETQGDFVRTEYTACTFGLFEHDGTLEHKVEQLERFEIPEDNTDRTFTIARTLFVSSYENYTIEGINSNDEILLDGSLKTFSRVESKADFFDETQRNLTVVVDEITTDFMQIKTNVSGQAKRDETYTNFSFSLHGNSLDLNGDVQTKVGNKTYSYTVNTPLSLSILDSTFNDEISIYGDMTIKAGNSKLKVMFQGSGPARVELDVNGDGTIDHFGSLELQ